MFWINKATIATISELKSSRKIRVEFLRDREL